MSGDQLGFDAMLQEAAQDIPRWHSQKKQHTFPPIGRREWHTIATKSTNTTRQCWRVTLTLP